ncbi:MAG: AraC family transcriptional regulator [Pseudomonadota bacterium]
MIDNAINVFKKGEYNIGILKDGAKFKVRCTAGLEYRYLTIFLPTELFNEFIHWQGSESFLQGSHTTFFNVVASLPIDSNQLQMVNEIIDFNDKNEAIKELRKESKLLELVISSFDKLRKTGVEHESLKCSLSQKDINLLYSARDYVLRDLRNPPSLKQVSVKIGLNEFKLKRGFKILFGTTIYAMLQDVRLDKAKSLIVEKGYSAKAAGQLVGYKSASHFNKIFKNKFLITPKQLTNQAQI